MVCKDCGKTKVVDFVPKPKKYFDQHLDMAEGALQAVWATTFDDSKQIRIQELIVEVQKLRSPHRLSLDNKLWALRKAAWEVGEEITCQYCRRHFYHDVIAGIDVALELEVKHYKHAAKAMTHKEVHKTYWLIQAIWHKLILPKLDIWGERIKWFIFKSQQVKNVQSV